MKWFKFLRKKAAAPAAEALQGTLIGTSVAFNTGGVTAPATHLEPGPSEMMNNFTPRAQQALALARKEAERFNHNFVGTEHLLLGLISLGQGTAVNVLRRQGLDLENVRVEVEKQVGMGPDQKMFGNIPYTPRVKKILALAHKEAKALHHTYVGTEHILLGLLREGDGVAGRVLTNLGVGVETTRQDILKELDPNWAAEAGVAASSAPHAAPVPARSQPSSIDTTKRYDVYCTERSQEVVVYRNALFKGIKVLLPGNPRDVLAQFVELEQADGQTVFVSKYSIIKFCEHGARPSPEPTPGQKP